MGEVLWRCANKGRGKTAVGFLWGVFIFLTPADIQENYKLKSNGKYRSPCVQSGGEGQTEAEAAIVQRTDACVCRGKEQVTVALERVVSHKMRPILDVGIKMTGVGDVASEERGVNMKERDCILYVWWPELCGETPRFVCVWQARRGWWHWTGVSMSLCVFIKMGGNNKKCQCEKCVNGGQHWRGMGVWLIGRWNGRAIKECLYA